MSRQPLLLQFVILLAVVALFMGCGRARYDARLVQADSLMWTAPDSALATLAAIDSLAGEANQAYRDLLMTQARYKTYQDITASDDSAITRAMNYYRAHSGQREKVTRACLYKGAVMEELGHVDSAMYYYKTAETTAGTKDYFNQGYSKMRIASLYESQHSQNDSNITRLKVAIHCFRHIGDTTFLISCYGMLGSLSGMKYPDSTERYLNRAIELAQRFDPPRQYTYKSKLAGLFFYHYMDYPRAKALAMDVMRNGSKDCLEYQFYYYATISFLKTGQLDSAKYVLSRFPAPIDAVDSMNWFDAMAEVAQAEGNLVDYGKYAVKSRELTSQILARSQEKQIVETEKEYSKQQILNNGLTARRHSHILAIILIVVTALLVMIIWILRKRLRTKDQERQHVENELNSVIDALNVKLERIGNINASASALVKERMDAFQELFDTIRFEAKREENSKKHRIITLRNIMSELGGQYAMMKVEPGDSFWEKIRSSVNGEFNGIVTFVEKRYPQLSDRDIRLFSLLCTNVSPQIIRLCMNITSARTASNYRGQLMKKMGLDTTFNEFIEKYMKGMLD